MAQSLFYAPPLTYDAAQPIAEEVPRLHGVMAGRPMFASVDVYLNEASSDVVCDGGSLLWLEGDVEMDTGFYGGCMDGCQRSCAGESCCMNTYTGNGYVGLGFTLP